MDLHFTNHHVSDPRMSSTSCFATTSIQVQLLINQGNYIKLLYCCLLVSFKRYQRDILLLDGLCVNIRWRRKWLLWDAIFCPGRPARRQNGTLFFPVHVRSHGNINRERNRARTLHYHGLSLLHLFDFRLCIISCLECIYLQLTLPLCISNV